MPRPRHRVRLEDGLNLDLNRLIRQNLVRPGAAWGSTILWSDRYSGEKIASGRVSADMTDDRRGWFRLQLGDLDQRITLVAAARHFGGTQRYFVCPQTGRRVSTLWKPPGAQFFASRHAWGRQVAYGSQFESPRDRALSAAQDIRYRLGGKDFVSIIDDVPPPRPKWMKRRTFEKIIRRCDAYEAAVNRHLAACWDRLKK